MKVHGIQAGMQSVHAGKAKGQMKRAEASNATTKPSAKPNEEVGGSEKGTKTKGVVRLLQEGHFKGVADVRLRINFHDELTQLSIQSVQIDFASQFKDFEQGVQQSFNTLLDTLGVDDDQRSEATDLFEGFKTNLSDLANGFIESGETDFSTAAAQFESSFNEFVANLESLLTPPLPPVVPEEPELVLEGAEVSINEIVGDEVQDETAEVLPPTPFESFRSELSAELNQLVESIDSTASTLPELSGPNGNGAAYNKFLEMLEALMVGEDSENPVADITI